MAGRCALFFYGSLLDADVRDAVMAEAAPREVAPAVLRDWRRVTRPGTIFPIIVPAPAASVEGVLARAIAPAALSRLIAYEGPDYRLVSVDVEPEEGGRESAQVFVPVRRFAGAGRRWDLGAWQRRHKRRFLARYVAGSCYR